MSRQTLGPGDRLVRIGAITFLVGTVGTIVTVAPLLLHTKRLPTPAYFVSMLMGLGLLLALVGLLRAALAQRTAVEPDEPAAPGTAAAGAGSGPVGAGAFVPAADPASGRGAEREETAAQAAAER